MPLLQPSLFQRLLSALNLITGSESDNGIYIFCPLLNGALPLMDGPCSYPSKITVVPAPYRRTVKSAYDCVIVPQLSPFLHRPSIRRSKEPPSSRVSLSLVQSLECHHVRVH